MIHPALKLHFFLLKIPFKVNSPWPRRCFLKLKMNKQTNKKTLTIRGHFNKLDYIKIKNESSEGGLKSVKQKLQTKKGYL